jgi:hypothetical protein
MPTITEGRTQARRPDAPWYRPLADRPRPRDALAGQDSAGLSPMGFLPTPRSTDRRTPLHSVLDVESSVDRPICLLLRGLYLQVSCHF